MRRFELGKAPSSKRERGGTQVGGVSGGIPEDRENDRYRPKSRFSRMRTISAPDASSTASGSSSIGFHLSVPGMRP